MLVMKKLHVFMLGAGTAGLIQGLALGSYGAFEDSLIYFELYKRFSVLGFYGGIQSFALQTGKYEPIIMLIFAFESLLTGGSISEYWFVVVNMILLNVFVSRAMFAFVSTDYKSKTYLFFIAFVASSSYFTFSKTIYVWRSIVAFFYLILFIKETSRKRYIWAGLAILSHASFLLFILLFILIEKISWSRIRPLYWSLGIVMAGALPIIASFKDIFGIFASAGTTLNFYEEGVQHSLKAWLATLFLLIILLFVHRGYMAIKVLTPLYLICLMTVITAIFSYNSYYVMTRITTPAMLIVGFLPYLVKTKNWRFQVARLCVLLSMLPSLRLMINMLIGNFRS
jgi:hypothetical protein